MMTRNDLGAVVEDLTYTQFSGAVEADPPPADGQASSAITDISTTTLVKGAPSNGVLPLDTPQALGTTSDPSFNTINVTDKPTTRGNLEAARRATPPITAGTIPLAKITPGGADGSITVNAEGIVTAYVAPT